MQKNKKWRKRKYVKEIKWLICYSFTLLSYLVNYFPNALSQQKYICYLILCYMLSLVEDQDWSSSAVWCISVKSLELALDCFEVKPLIYIHIYTVCVYSGFTIYIYIHSSVSSLALRAEYKALAQASIPPSIFLYLIPSLSISVCLCWHVKYITLTGLVYHFLMSESEESVESEVLFIYQLGSAPSGLVLQPRPWEDHETRPPLWTR